MCSEGNQPEIDFLQTQLEYARRTQDIVDMNTPDDNGLLPLHPALKDNVSLGSVKLLNRGNSAALQLSDLI